MAACAGGQAPDMSGMPAHPGLENRQKTAVPGEFLVTLYDGKTQKDLIQELSMFTVVGVENITGVVFHVKLQECVLFEDFEKSTKGSSVIKSVQPNFLYKANHKKGGPY